MGVFIDPATGCRFAYSGTAYGDGVFGDQDDHLYGVDTGSLACIPLAMIDAATLVRTSEKDHSFGSVCSGRLVTFDAPGVVVPCDERGVIRFGPE